MSDYTVETRLFGEVPVKNDHQSTEINNQKLIINMNNSTKDGDVAVIDISEEGSLKNIEFVLIYRAN